MGWMIRNSNLCGGKRMSPFHTRPVRHWGLTSPLYNWYRRSLLVEKRPGRVVDHALPTTAKVKNVNSCTSTPSLCLYIVLLWGDLFLYLYLIRKHRTRYTALRWLSNYTLRLAETDLFLCTQHFTHLHPECPDTTPLLT